MPVRLDQLLLDAVKSIPRVCSRSKRAKARITSQRKPDMLRVMSGGWLASSSGTSGPSMQQHQRQMSQPGDAFADSNEPPSFPMPGSVQRIGGQRNTENYDDSPSFHFSPPSPSSSVTNSSGASTPPTPRALNSRPKPSHRPFSPEPDTLTLALPPSTTTKPIRKSKKMALKPGHSYLDWARLCKEGGDEMRVCTVILRNPKSG